MTKGNDKESWKPECRKLLEEMIHDRETQPFRAPVPYEEYGLFDYPTIVKHPMDLGTIKQKFNEYTSPKMFQADVYLVWDNCMLYNQEGSDYYKLAERLKKKFKDKYAKIRNPHKAKAPKVIIYFSKFYLSFSSNNRHPHNLLRNHNFGTNPMLALQDDEKARFSQNIFCLESDQLGHVVRILDDKCDKCIDKTDPEEIEIDVDKIDPLTFRALENYIKQVYI